MALPEIGSAAHPFTLLNQDGSAVSLSDYAGKNVLLWFFPRAYGGNCTKEAGAFRDRGPDYAGKNTEVLGITWSPTEDLKSWSQDLAYGSHLLHDADRSVALAYGAAETADQERPSRVSILIGPDGKVAKTYVVADAEVHPVEALADLG